MHWLKMVLSGEKKGGHLHCLKLYISKQRAIDYFSHSMKFKGNEVYGMIGRKCTF